MKILCPKCQKKYTIDEINLPKIKKKNPKCNACGTFLFSTSGKTVKNNPTNRPNVQKPVSPKAKKTSLKKPRAVREIDMPESIGGFQVEGVLGKGGMGTVYKCMDQSLKRYVAIKVLILQEEKHQKRFIREARALAKLSHPNITQIYNAGDIDDSPYFAMEYVDGLSTEDMLKTEKRFPIPRALDIAIQVCEGLKKANEIGFVHRDIKPANILINSDGVVKITDFGLAKLVDDTQHLTQTQMMMGTPTFLSPEQAKGEKVDFRTDIYALGVTLYRYIIGRAPFTADDPMALIMKHIKEPVAFPAPSANFFVPPAIAGIIRKMMAKDPDHRYLSYDQLISELTRLKKSFQALQADEVNTTYADKKPVSNDTTGTTGIYTSKMDHTIMMPSKLSHSSSRVPAKFWSALAACILVAFFILVIKYGFLETNPSETPEKEVVELRLDQIVPDESPEESSPELEESINSEPVRIEVSAHDSEELGENTYRIFGTIHNVGQNSAKEIFIEVIVLNYFDEVIGRQKIQAEPSVIMPGEPARFSFIFRNAEDFDRYIVRVLNIAPISEIE